MIDPVVLKLLSAQGNLFGDANLPPFVHWLGELFTIKTPELKRQPIVAAMFGTFVKNETEARKFWADVARGGTEFDDSAPATNSY